MASEQRESIKIEARKCSPPFLRRHFCHPELTGLVDRITGYRESGRALHHSVEMAALVVPLVISWGEPFEIAFGRAPTREDTYASFTSGLYPGHVLINSTGGAECVQIDFTPLGAYRFFGLPMHEISGWMVPLDDLADREIAVLREKLGDEPDWDRRLHLTEAFVRERLQRAAPVSPAITWAYEHILWGQGPVRVGDIAKRLDWSRKHLAERFRKEIGIGPKAVARMVRFNRALALARATSGRWAEIAAECGYADQAHLVREFHEFAGESPAAWQKRAA
ncbi:helix-turn-helix domain-containing protein [Mesorhizobium sp. A623]